MNFYIEITNDGAFEHVVGLRGAYEELVSDMELIETHNFVGGYDCDTYRDTEGNIRHFCLDIL